MPRTPNLIALAVVLVAHAVAAGAVEPPAPLPPVPSPKQLAWQRLEMTMFLHFGINTFTGREWGDGREDPAIFNPSALDARQWARVAKEAGFGLMILTAKHHDGFCLWPSAFTEHSVKGSAWKGGKGDVVREFVDACRAEGLKVGIYLSPWDRNNPAYGDTPRYNEHFVNQLEEIAKNYGPIDEFWFDGACGEGPNGKKQAYDWAAYYEVIYRDNPGAVIAICGPDIRWVGNESGVARPGESSVQPARAERHEAAAGKVWYPAECDVSIRPGWFYHAAQDGQVKSLDHLLDIYFKSVGRNSVLLLNVPPDRRGLIAEPDVARLRELRAALDALFREDVAAGRPASADAVRGRDPQFGAARAVDGDPASYWATDDGVTSARLEVDLGGARAVNVIEVREYLPLGERVRAYRVEGLVNGAWRPLGRGTVIGHGNLLRIPAARAAKLALVIEQAAACPAIAAFGAYFDPRAKDTGSGSLAAHRPAEASNVHPGGTVWGGDKAVDDDMATRWATSDETRACTLTVDLQGEADLGRVELYELEPRITKFEVQVRGSAEEPWRTAFAGARAGKKFAADFPSVKARQVRLNILDAVFAPTIWEFRVLPPARPAE